MVNILFTSSLIDEGGDTSSFSIPFIMTNISETSLNRVIKSAPAMPVSQASSRGDQQLLR